MHKITFQCRTISPMFLSGPDTDQAELRPPSIKGALRFWWRAMNASLMLHADSDDLRNREAALWGDTKHRSSVLITCQPEKILPFNDKLNPSLKYMAYGAEQRKAFGVPYTFDIILSSRSQADLEEAKSAFSLLVQFGGLGAKSRNGFGALACEEADDLSTVLNYACFKTKEQMPFTAISEGTQVYRSRTPKKDWETAIAELKAIYADQAKSKVQPKKNKVYVAAPCEKAALPERHAKLHLMSLTEIDGELYYTILFLPYDYLADYDKTANHAIKSEWERVIKTGDNRTNSFNANLFEAKDKYGRKLLVNLLNN